MNALLRWYLRPALVVRILGCFVAGSLIGGALWYVSQAAGSDVARRLMPYVSPFGTVFVHMLKMIVVPVIFFSLVVGAASLPIQRFGRVGVKTLGWYLATSALAAGLGVCLALAVNPGAGSDLSRWQDLARLMGDPGSEFSGKATAGGVLAQLLLTLFRNPFEALAEGNFLPIIVFSILFGLAIRVCAEAGGDERRAARLEQLAGLLGACQDAVFRMVGWILEYSPIGVLALTVMNFGLNGPKIVGPYVSVTLGVVLGVLVMVFAVYPALLWAATRRNPFPVLRRTQEAMLMAFITRSSAATLPVTLKVAEEELKVRNELASFSLPLGATINMDGVCVHLPMFAVLAANLFGIPLTLGSLVLLVLTTVLSSIGAGGVPGGSLMLLYVILQTMGLSGEQVAVVVALALGINPILDMFETMNNVTGDLVCTYAVAHREGLIHASPPP
ncbi:MAG TPA: dicarboxylate/amino acid:cation symporter [Planctomycetota bacterium]|nr:dicarboxylate/amino acid:cation symporter [Planctomycetota bacterium]HRR81142.1 dicarboxylate/amino acid:cation symporter [Planctomycetota bacterium]HRT94704.1 dicarboxylate/amino acid:cation symporter [Planctomycetota bacterium]